MLREVRHPRIRGIAEAVGAAVDAAYGADAAAIRFEESLDRMSESLERNGTASGFATEKGRANERALRDVARAAYDNAAAQLTNGATLEDVAAQTLAARDDFVAFARQLDYTEEGANALADDLGLTTEAVRALDTEIAGLEGKQVEVAVEVLTRAYNGVMSLAAAISALQGKTVGVNVITNYQTRGQRPAHMGPKPLGLGRRRHPADALRPDPSPATREHQPRAMIAIGVERERATVMTDSASYSKEMQVITLKTTKAVALAHPGMIITAQGDETGSTPASSGARTAPRSTPSPRTPQPSCQRSWHRWPRPRRRVQTSSPLSAGPVMTASAGSSSPPLTTDDPSRWWTSCSSCPPRSTVAPQTTSWTTCAGGWPRSHSRATR